MLDLDQEGPPRLGRIGLVQTPQIFYNRNILVRLTAKDLLIITPLFRHGGRCMSGCKMLEGSEISICCSCNTALLSDKPSLHAAMVVFL